LSFDHRISSGLEVSNFLNELKQRFEYRKEDLDTSYDEVQCYKCLRSVYDNLNNQVFFTEVIYGNVGKKHICSICQSGW